LPIIFTLEVENEAAVSEERARLKRLGVEVSVVQDAQYSKLFHFRDPDGHICAVSTPSDFSIDESGEALGQKLCLPERFEAQRIEIERHLSFRPAPTPIPAS
jgi:glyoxalase family protein